MDNCWCSDPYAGWAPKKGPILKTGDNVVNTHGMKGMVVRPGPYGDEPHQVCDENGQYHPFINDDGTCPYNKEVWSISNNL